MGKNNRKPYIKLFLLLVMLAALVSVFSSCKKDEENPYTVFKDYKAKWEKQDFKGMYGMLSSDTKKNITEQQFSDRYSKIYKDIEVKNIALQMTGQEKKIGKEESLSIPFSLNMSTIAGDLKMDSFEAKLVKEKLDKGSKWTIAWDENMIFPGMDKDDKVLIDFTHAKRGTLYDRNGKPLAVEDKDTLVSIYIYPASFNKDKDNNIKAMAGILNIDPSVIQKKLDANKDPEQRVDIVKILFSDTAKKTALLAINGVRGDRLYGRVYPGGEAFGELIGYTGPITAEELSNNKGKGYNSNSRIGKAGLEKVYESRLKGTDGVTLYISKQTDGKQTDKKVIAQVDAKNGEDIKLSVDMDLQQKIYDNMKNDSGACAALNPKTGEVLALVSSPSYDSNMLVTYRTKDQEASAVIKDALNLNRFSKLYAPGSTFKLVTGAIGLSLGKINPEEAMNDVKGTEWQGQGVKVTRVDNTSEPINLRSAYVHSDNIYFARAALKIGKDDFIKGCSNFGIGEALPFDFPIVKSQVANNGINSNQALADSGYGQGEVVASPLHTALIYSTLVNDGNIMTPLLESPGDKVTSKVWKQGAISDKNIKILLDDLTAVVEDPSGTGHKAQINGVKIAGKTGTAELKKSNTDNAEENGWFTAVNTDNPKIVISMVIDNVKNRGESHYVVPLVKNVLEYYLKK